MKKDTFVSNWGDFSTDTEEVEEIELLDAFMFEEIGWPNKFVGDGGFEIAAVAVGIEAEAATGLVEIGSISELEYLLVKNCLMGVFGRLLVNLGASGSGFGALSSKTAHKEEK